MVLDSDVCIKDDISRKRLSPWSWIPTLYFAEGLPYVTVMTLSVIMYKRLGINNTDIAIYTSWLYLPWVIKPIWSPIVDMFGTKRLWVILMQCMIGLSLACVALYIPLPMFFRMTLAMFWITAFLSATHDIAADGFYMLALDSHEQSFYVGIRSTFYRIATLFGQGILVAFAGWLELRCGSVEKGWMIAIGLLGIFFILVSIYHTCILPHPVSDRKLPGVTLSNIAVEFAQTFVSFFKKPQASIAVAFMLLFRLPEAQLLKLIGPFMLDPRELGGLGLTTVEVGMLYGTIGVAGLTVGGIVGGILASRGGLRKWLWPMAWSISLTCVTFCYLAIVQPESVWIIGLCVLVEQVGYGFGFTAYMLYLIYFSEGPCRTAHYALCTGFMALGMMLPGMAAGWLQSWMGYSGFFWWVMICCIATIGVTCLIKVPEDFGRKHSYK